MRFSEIINESKEEISQEWCAFAREHVAVAKDLSEWELRDHLEGMLEWLVADVETRQNGEEQERKSKGLSHGSELSFEAPLAHGTARAESGYGLADVSSEFRALRASVLRVIERRYDGNLGEPQFQELIRFNEAIDEAWLRSLRRAEQLFDQSQHWFLGILGHDLRSPLQTFSGITSVLALSDNLTSDEREMLRTAESSVSRMDEMIRNLLELTRLRLGTGLKIHPRRTCLHTLCGNLLRQMRVAYPNAKLTLESPGEMEIWADTERLCQMLANLISNALRHGKPGGPVTVSLEAPNEHVIIRLHNPGKPIPPEVRERLFSGKPVAGRHGVHQLGLGLYIVREIVASHDGKLAVESTEENGTTFTIHLPRQPTSAPAEAIV
ncbi:MAG: ATP-binding protein [Opitutales bacterium]